MTSTRGLDRGAMTVRKPKTLHSKRHVVTQFSVLYHKNNGRFRPGLLPRVVDGQRQGAIPYQIFTRWGKMDDSAHSDGGKEIWEYFDQLSRTTYLLPDPMSQLFSRTPNYLLGSLAG